MNDLRAHRHLTYARTYDLNSFYGQMNDLRAHKHISGPDTETLTMGK